MNRQDLREEIVQTAMLFNSTALSLGTSGNLSCRTNKGFLITPSGIPYQEMSIQDIIGLDHDGTVIEGEWKPSSEWRIHREIYRERADCNAIIHVHSPWATAIACTRQSIPAFHYEVAIIGGNSIPCADYARFGTQELADNVLLALKDQNACLMANHGQLSLGESLSTVLRMAQTVEVLAKQYTLSMQLGGPVLLDDDEMEANVEKFRHYGKQGL